MKLFALLKKFRADEAGAVTVDWVVLTAAVVALALGALSTIKTQVDAKATTIAGSITSAGTTP